MERKDVKLEDVSPMMREYLKTKSEYEGIILFYRLGDFYEMFFDDAITASHELELTLTGKQCGLSERVPMCGIPYHASEIYIDKLIKKGYKVAICEQLEDPKMAKGMVKRDVTEIISSGTIISSNSLNEKENNFIGSIVDFKYCYVLTYTDITTGELYCEILDHNNSKVINKIIFLGIKEVILDSNVDKEIYHKLRDNYRITTSLIDDIYEGND